MSLPSRKITVVDVPDVQGVEAKFIYNFFTPDERTNSSGDPRVPGAFYNEETQTLVNNNTLRSEVPRYVEVNFEPSSFTAFGTLSQVNNEVTTKLVDLSEYGESLSNIASEDQITNESFTSFRECDSNGKNRIGKKVQELSSILGLSFSDSDQSLALSDLLGVERNLIQDLISPYNDKKTLFVNKLDEAEKFTLFDKAASLSLSSLLNKRTVEWMMMGGDDVSPLSTLQAKDMSKIIQENFNATANPVDLNVSDVHPSLYPYKIEPVTSENQVGIIGAATVGYVVVKKLITPSGRIQSISEYLLEGKNSTRYVDAAVVYGAKYSYSVKAIYRVDAIVEDDLDANKSLKKIKMLIASRPSKVITALTEEYQPPLPPDGVFYRFNYDKGRGLLITWQMPPGTSRDVKYFQIFRRKTIHEPFQCIAQLDFDNSFLKTVKPEKVRKSLVIKSPGAVTFFEDKFFNRDRDDFIYAVCAVDAHGLSSNYSAQTLVGFDKIKNLITLKSISPPGGLKAYPNFFIDPDLDDNIAVDSFAQDAIFDSGHTKIKVYFTPDAKTVQVSDNSIAKGFISKNEGGKYKMHLLNLDLQKSTTAEIEIEDLQQTQ